MFFKPLRDNVLVKLADIPPDENELILMTESPWAKAIVVEVGEGYRLPDGTFGPLTVQVGDELLVNKVFVQHNVNVIGKNIYPDIERHLTEKIVMLREGDITAIMGRPNNG